MSKHNIHFQNKIKSSRIISNILAAGMEKKKLVTQERVLNSRGKRAIGVRAMEVLLYFISGL